MAQIDSHAKTSEPTNRKIFVTGLEDIGGLEDVTVDVLRSYFSKYGTIIDISILNPSRSSAFITFETQDMSRNVLEQTSAHKVNGDTRRVHVYEAISGRPNNHENGYAASLPAGQSKAQITEAAKTRPMNRSVQVRNLPHNTTVKDVRRWFSEYGTLICVNQPHSLRSTAYVEFETWDMAQSVLEQEGQLKINGEIIPLRAFPVFYSENSDYDSDSTVDFTIENNPIPKMYHGSDMTSLASEMRDTLRLIQCLEPARGHPCSMVSLYLNNGDSSLSNASDDTLIDILEQDHEDDWQVMSQTEKEMYAVNRKAVQWTFQTVKQRLQTIGETSRRGRVIFCGTVISDGGEMEQVFVEFEPYTLISDKSFCFFDSKFHLGPLAFRLIHYQMDDGLEASDFAKVSEVLGEGLERKLTSFSNVAPREIRLYHECLIPLSNEDSFLFDMKIIRPSGILDNARVAEVTRILRLIESLRITGDDNMKKLILIVTPSGFPCMLEFLDSDQHLKEAQVTPGSLMPASGRDPKWRLAAEELVKVGSFPGDLSAKRCIEFAEERLNSYSQISKNSGLIIYCGLRMLSSSRAIKFSVELEPIRHVECDKVIYMPEGHYNLQPLEELLLFDDLLVPFALNPENAPPGTMSQEKRELLTRLVGELERTLTASYSPPAKLRKGMEASIGNASP